MPIYEYQCVDCGGRISEWLVAMITLPSVLIVVA